jgi:CheY-like chemotaxis protein
MAKKKRQWRSPSIVTSSLENRSSPYKKVGALDSAPKEAGMDILIADDDPGFRGTLKRILDAKPNVHTVWEARDGEEAVQLTRAFRPDVVLMDLAMPRIDGLEATRMIKEKQPEVRVIVCSVHNESIYRRAAAVDGADAFVPKSKCLVMLDLDDDLTGKDRACAERIAGR